MTVQRICERCHKVWEIDAAECPDDGGKLMTISSPESLVGRVIEDKLTLTGVLGQGGMGVVYRARQHSMDREVAVKVLHPSFSNDAEAVRRFLHEAKAATRLDHPNIITVFDFGRTDDGLLYIVMELLVGHNLGQEVDAAALEPARAVHILTMVADAVEHAHGRGLIHRDLKPENVFLIQGSSLRGDHVKVLDFGIATMRAQEGIDKITRTGAVCGTPAYMSPEQVLGDKVDARSDVYSLAVMAFEMLTGEHPFRAETAMRQMLAHLDHPVPSFAEVAGDLAIPPALERAVRRGLEKKREQRTQSALEFAHELVRAIDKTPTAPALSSAVVGSKTAPVTDRRALDETGRATPAPKPPRKLSRYLPIGAVLAVIVAALAFLALRSPKDQASDEVAPISPELTAALPSSAEQARPLQPEVKPGLPSSVEAARVKPEPAVGLPSSVEAARVKPEPAVGLPSSVEAAPVKPEPAVGLPSSVEAAPVKPEPAVGLPSSAEQARPLHPEPEPAPAPFELTSLPRGASVVIDGEVIGKTPFSLPRPQGDAIVKVTLERAGYRDFKLTLTKDSPAPEMARLQRVPKPKREPGFTRID